MLVSTCPIFCSCGRHAVEKKKKHACSAEHACLYWSLEKQLSDNRLLIYMVKLCNSKRLQLQAPYPQQISMQKAFHNIQWVVWSGFCSPQCRKHVTYSVRNSTIRCTSVPISSADFIFCMVVFTADPDVDQPLLMGLICVLCPFFHAETTQNK